MQTVTKGSFLMAEQTEDTSTPQPQLVEDLILNTLNNSVQAVVQLSGTPGSDKAFASAVDALIKGYMPPMPGPIPKDDDCTGSPDPVVKPLCAIRRQAESQATFEYAQSSNAASGALFVLVSGWSLAVSNYETALDTAKAVMDAAVKTAKATYDTAHQLRPDAISRSLSLWYTLENAVVAAVTSYESAAASAGSALATAAGGLLTGYVTYADQIKAADAARMNSLSSADQAFWQGVESGRDN
jgi:hypothetical protein